MTNEEFDSLRKFRSASELPEGALLWFRGSSTDGAGGVVSFTTDPDWAPPFGRVASAVQVAPTLVVEAVSKRVIGRWVGSHKEAKELPYWGKAKAV